MRRMQEFRDSGIWAFECAKSSVCVCVCNQKSSATCSQNWRCWIVCLHTWVPLQGKRLGTLGISRHYNTIYGPVKVFVEVSLIRSQSVMLNDTKQSRERSQGSIDE